MKNQTTKMLCAFILILGSMFSFTSAKAQNDCSGNKILMSKGGNGCGCHCKKKCVAPENVQTYLDNGWHYGSCYGFCCYVELKSDSTSNEATLAAAQSPFVSTYIFEVTGSMVSSKSNEIIDIEENKFFWNMDNQIEKYQFLQFQPKENLVRSNSRVNTHN